MTPRVLVVTTVASTLEAFLLPFARHFRGLGWRVDALANGATLNPQVIDAFTQVGEIDWTRNYWDPRHLGRTGARLRTVLRAGEYDLVHVHTPVAGFVTRAAVRLLRLPRRPRVIYTAHGFHFHPLGRPLPNAVFSRAERTAARWTDHLVVINEADERAARALGLDRRTTLHRHPGIGVDLAQWDPAAVPEEEVRAARTALAARDGRPVFLMVAEFSARKNQATAVEALAQLDRGDAVLALAGVGPRFDAVRALAAARGVADRVHFLGPRRDVPALMRASTALVSASLFEGLPRNVLEAMALGLPVIGSAVRGTSELLADGAGRLVPYGDAGALARAMAEVVAEPDAARQAAARARARVEERYALPHVIAAHERLYAQALAELPRA